MWICSRHIMSPIYHGLYGSTSYCISHGPCQSERAIFDPHSSETPGPIFMKSEIYNYFPDTTPHAKFQGPMWTWVVWANSQFDAWKLLSFFFPFLVTPTGRIFGHILTLNTSLCVVFSNEVPFGVRKIKFEIWPHLHQKNLKIGTLSWRSMENCSRVVLTLKR